MTTAEINTMMLLLGIQGMTVGLAAFIVGFYMLLVSYGQDGE